MSDNRKYYYLKLKDNFFDSDEMVVLESMPDGYKYSNILLKLYLKSLKGNGKLMLNDHIPYSDQMIATVTRHSVGDVDKALTIFKKLGLIEILDNGAVYMTDIQNFIGRSSTEGDRKRAYRNKIDAEKKLQGVEKGQMSDKWAPELEIELDKEIDKNPLFEKSNKGGSKPSSPQSKSKKRIYDEKSPYMRLAQFLNKKILENDPKFKVKNIQGWADVFRKLVELDKRDLHEVSQVIKWCQQDDFWHSNILSAGKLRNQYSQLLQKMQTEMGITDKKPDSSKPFRTSEQDYDATEERIKKTGLPF